MRGIENVREGARAREWRLAAPLVLACLIGLLLASSVSRGGNAVPQGARPAVRVGWWFGLERVRVAADKEAVLSMAGGAQWVIGAGQSVLITSGSGESGVQATWPGGEQCGNTARVGGGVLQLSAVVAGSRKAVAQQVPWPVEIRRDRGGLVLIVEVPLEEYVAGVVAGEASSRSARALLEALAVGARNFALANRSKHGAQGFDVCVSSHCQNFRVSPPGAASQAAEATRGLVLAKGGVLVRVNYHTTCGGTTDAASDIWGGANPLGLLGVMDDARAQPPALGTEAAVADFLANGRAYCSADRFYRWSRLLGPEEMQSRLEAGLAALGLGPVSGRLLEVKVTRRTPGGRAAELLVKTEGGSVGVTGENVRWVFGGGGVGGAGSLPSRFFVIKGSEGGGYAIRGGGYGHGVGICLAGAGCLASSGRSAGEILAHYYPGTSVVALSDLAGGCRP